MSKAKRQKKQDERAIKQTNDILSGRVKVVYYEPPKKRSQSNRIGGAAGSDEEDELTGWYLRLLGLLLPGILAMLSTIEDPRNPNKTTHSFALLMLYGLIIFLCHTTSRRAANREIGGSMVSELIEVLVPDFSSMPHADTLARLLEDIDENALESQYEELLKVFIKSDNIKTINPGRFLVAADGTQKFSRDYCWDDRALSRNAGDPDKESYYAYMLESVLILDNGMVLPLLTEVLENGEHLDGNGKQDCETKAFKRLAERLVALLGKGCVTVVLDGLYATGPIMSLCKNYGWEYMINLKRDSLKTVWEDFEGLRIIETENVLEAQWGDRSQTYRWSNDITYIYGDNNKKLSLNLVTCTETWHEEHPRKGKPRDYITDYAWLSSSKITEQNVFMLCTKIARCRWRIENHFLVLKHKGYHYTHCFSYDWNAMKGFQSLMKFANFINAFITCSKVMEDVVVAEGKQGLIKKVWSFLLQCGLPDNDDSQKLIDTMNQNRSRKIRFRGFGF